MSKLVLKTVADAMQELGIEYGFMTYGKHPIAYPYLVGDYTESNELNEDGMQEGSFRLTGFSRGSWSDLIEAQERIEEYFDPICGKIIHLDNGKTVAIFYGNTQVINTYDAELKRININLLVKEWKVN